MTKLSPDISPVLASSERFRPFAMLLERFNRLPIWLATIQHLEQTDTSFLEYLAADADITDTVAWHRANGKREQVALIEAAYTRHRMRGTDAALIQAAAEAGAHIRRIIAPPHKFFPASSLTPAQKNAWLAQHPELRIYPRRLPGTEEVAMVGHAYPGAGVFPGPGTALQRSRIRATLVRNGVETELETADWQIASQQRQVVNEFVIPGNGGSASFCGTPLGFIAATKPVNRQIRLADVALYDEPQATLGLRTVTPGLTPLNADGEMVSQLATAPTDAQFAGQFIGFPMQSTAANRQYLRIRLFDPDVPSVAARAAAHVGYTRLGMPPHTAEIEVSMLGKRDPAWGRFSGQPLVAGDKAPLKRLLDNLQLAKRASDTLLVNTRTYRPTRAGRALAGDVIAGSFTNQ